jgi:hypothetical protein
MKTPQRFTPPPVSPEISLGDYLPASARIRSSEPARPALPPAPSALAAALDRLEETVDQENAALDAHAAIDLEDLNRRKSHSLLELTRLARGIPALDDALVQARLQRLRDKLARNHRALEFHMAAVREIADLMLGVLGEAESDGTYGMTRRTGAAR